MESTIIVFESRFYKVPCRTNYFHNLIAKLLLHFLAFFKYNILLLVYFFL